MACESEPPWPGEPDRRSGSDERELVSSLEPQPLSLELSVGTAVPVKWKDLLFGRRVIRRRHFSAREIFSRGFRELTKPLPAHYARSLSNAGFCAAPRWARGSCRLGCSRGSEANRSFTAGRRTCPASPENLALRGLCQVCGSGCFQRAIDGVIRPHCIHLLPLQKRKKSLLLFCLLFK